MKFFTRPYKDARGKWHRDIIGPLPDAAGVAPVFEECHAGSGVTGCPGFADEASAKADGDKRIKQLEHDKS
jgi:hypothetical protein